MEAQSLHTTSAPTLPGAPRLRLLEGRDAVSERSQASLRAWILLFGSLSFAAGHGVFLFTALTRLEKLPGRSELGGALESVVLAWFLAAVPLALTCVPLRGRFLRLSATLAWSLASSATALTLAAFTFYLRAIALA
ncbi:MAG: hypothetical protein EXS08_02310 [Planctomycetes bacterium]|nr:hypothetical protein [Planctomycetota bacterium]